MTASANEPLRPPGPPAAKGRRGPLLLAVAVLALAGAAVGAWRWFARPGPPDPPMPAEVRDPEVREVLEHARHKVLEAPHSADTWSNFGLILLAHLFDREADVCFARAARLAPGDARWPYARGLIALKSDPDNDLGLLRQAAELAVSSWPEHRAEVCLQLAEALLERRKLDEAEALFRDEWQRRPGHPRTALGLGTIALARGDLQAAAEFFQTAHTSRFARKNTTGQLAALARLRGELGPAEALEQEYATLLNDPRWPDPLLDQVDQLQVGHRRRERQADELERQHRYAEAAAVWLRQLEREPTVQAYVGAGINLARTSDYERALPLLREGVRRDPDHAQAQYTLALALFGQAEKEWRQTPGSERAKEGFREALPHARRAAELKSDHAMAYLFWGLCLKYLGESKAAVAPRRQGVAVRPALFELQLALGEALLESGRKQEAEKHLENARRLDPKDPRLVQALKRLHQPKPGR
jgi:tetratricopeptide (TPR) repeat protein